MMDEMKAVRDTRFIEDDFKVLKDVDDQIQTLLNKREELVQQIRSQHCKNAEMMEREYDWFLGVVMQQPVPERAVVSSGYDDPKEGPGRSVRY